MIRSKTRQKLVMVPITIVMIFMAFIMLLPIIWMFFSAFKPDSEIISYPPTLFPTSFTLKNFVKCMQRIDIFAYLKNSVFYSLGTTIPSLLVNTLAGYAFARYDFKGKNIIFLIFLATMMIPFQVIMIPLFLEIHMMGMYNTYDGYVQYLCRSDHSQDCGSILDIYDALRICGIAEGIRGSCQNRWT